MGDAVAQVTLIIYLVQTDGRGLAVGLLLLAEGTPYLLSPLAGTLADRVDQRRLLLYTEIGQGLLMAVIALTLPPLPLLAALVLSRGALAMIFQPAGRSAIPTLVGDRDLPSANGLMGAGGQSSMTLGPALAGLLYPVLGPQAVLGGAAALSLVSTALLVRLPPLRATGTEEGTPDGSFLADTARGLSYLRSQPVARTVAVTLFGTVLFAALDNVTLAFFGSETLGVDERGVGLLFAAPALGLVAGGLVMARWGASLPTARVLVTAVAITSVGLLGTAASPVLAAALLAQFAGGLGNGLQNATNDTLIQRSVERGMLGRVFGTVYGGAFLASSIAYGLGGLLLDATSPRSVYVVAGTGVLAIAVLCALALRRSGALAPPADPEPA